MSSVYLWESNTISKCRYSKLRSPGDHKGPRFDKNPATFLLQAFVSRPWVLPSMLFIFWQLPWWDLESKLYWNTCMRSQLSSTMPISRFAPKGLETDKSHLWPWVVVKYPQQTLNAMAKTTIPDMNFSEELIEKRVWDHNSPPPCQ